MRFHIISIILVFLFSSCSGIKVINERDFYSEAFLKKLSSIQIIYRDGDKQLALKKVDDIQDETITKAEKAKKYNFKGVLLYALGNVEGAIEQFKIARENVDQDLYLKADIGLNLASAHFKLQKLELVETYLDEIDEDYLKSREKENYYRLTFTLANQKSDYKKVVYSLLNLTGEMDSFKSFENFKYKEVLIDNFRKLSQSERVNIIYSNKDKNPIVVAYLGRLEALNRFYLGDREGAQDVVEWLESKFSNIAEVSSFVQNYKFKSANFSKIQTGAVGVIVPLSGKLGKYGEKVVTGVNTALAHGGGNELVNIYVKDNQDNPYLAKKRVQELILKHHVSVIIGGLFSHLAKEEYLEARKYGVLFISLSPVYLPRSEKSHLLVEVQGSVESQIASITEDSFLEKFGRRVAVLYPETDAGESYVNELWSLHSLNKIDLANIHSFERGIKDYRKPVESVLGLRFPRERKEELQIWSDIKNASKRNVRIVNTLPPVIDFDWVFVPISPKEAIQLVPTFSYYDAKDLKYIGGPSWINDRLRRERRGLGGSLYLIGSDTNRINTDFMTMYIEKNKVKPQLVDTISYDGMNIVLKVLAGQNFESRDELAKHLRSFSKLEGITSEWNMVDGLWLKKMDLLSIGSKGFSKIEI